MNKPTIEEMLARSRADSIAPGHAREALRHRLQRRAASPPRSAPSLNALQTLGPALLAAAVLYAAGMFAALPPASRDAQALYSVREAQVLHAMMSARDFALNPPPASTSSRPRRPTARGGA